MHNRKYGIRVPGIPNDLKIKCPLLTLVDLWIHFILQITPYPDPHFSPLTYFWWPLTYFRSERPLPITTFDTRCDATSLLLGVCHRLYLLNTRLQHITIEIISSDCVLRNLISSKFNFLFKSSYLIRIVRQKVLLHSVSVKEWECMRVYFQVCNCARAGLFTYFY